MARPSQRVGRSFGAHRDSRVGVVLPTGSSFPSARRGACTSGSRRGETPGCRRRTCPRWPLWSSARRRPDCESGCRSASRRDRKWLRRTSLGPIQRDGRPDQASSALRKFRVDLSSVVDREVPVAIRTKVTTRPGPTEVHGLGVGKSSARGDDHLDELIIGHANMVPGEHPGLPRRPYWATRYGR